MATGGDESGPTLYASFPKSAPDLLRMTQMEGMCRNGRTGSLCLGPGITLTVEDSEEDSENDAGSQPCSPNLNSERRQPNGSIGRSQSMRTVRRPQPYDPTDPGSRFRQRISSIPTEKAVASQGTTVARTSSNYSLPLPGEAVHYQRLRNFSVTPKGVINRGDSFRSKSRSTLNISSNKPNSEQVTKPDEETTKTASLTFVASISTVTPGPACERQIVPPVIVTETMKHRVLIIGSPDVGKSCLTTQFTTSEYINAYDTSLAEDNEKSVTIVLNEQESELVFIEHSFIENTPIGQLLAPDVDACVVVYSVTNKASFQCAKMFLEQLRKTENTDRKAVIIVGNKTDLARLRTVTPEGLSVNVDYASCGT
ncbi:uncharacterized protein LOC106462261 [Limulus polyphemus]|uniref:Uncharacterized protein LOC106462261 n=1 Tax=Limulus polyphemus TaxID=6850 RepID=A0ABM1SNF9_LIMPO|nr:uncharacterized protein LOC106462261 [Limulus polyphemus]